MIMAPPVKPAVSIAISGTVDALRLRGREVDLDIYGNTIYVQGYRVRRELLALLGRLAELLDLEPGLPGHRHLERSGRWAIRR